MKKKFTMSVASFLAISSLTPVAFADSVNTLEQSPVESELTTDQLVESKKNVQKLTLEEAIEHALKSNFSLMELDYALNSLRLTEEEVEENYDDLKDTLWDLEDERDRLEDYYDNLLNPPVPIEPPTEEEPPVEDDSLQGQLGRLNNSLASLDNNLSLHTIARTAQSTNTTNAGSSTLEGNIDYLKDVLQTTEETVDEFAEQEKQITETSQAVTGVREQLKSIERTIDTLESSLKQIESNIKTTENTRKQIEESIKFSTTASFVSLLLTQKQIDFLETTVSTQKQKVNGIQRRHELGLISSKEYQKSTRDITQLEYQIQQAKNRLKSDKEAFALTIGYSYEHDYEVDAPNTGELKPVTKEASLTDIINNSFNMKNAKEELNLAFENLNDVVERAEDDDDATDLEERKADLEVDIKQLKVKSLQKDLENSINQLYSQIQLQYEAMQDYENKSTYAEEDTKDLQRYYQLGLMSKEQYELATLSIKEAEFNYNNAKYQYYLLLKQEELLKSGVIITN